MAISVVPQISFRIHTSQHEILKQLQSIDPWEPLRKANTVAMRELRRSLNRIVPDLFVRLLKKESPVFRQLLSNQARYRGEFGISSSLTGTGWFKHFLAALTNRSSENFRFRSVGKGAKTGNVFGIGPTQQFESYALEYLSSSLVYKHTNIVETNRVSEKFNPLDLSWYYHWVSKVNPMGVADLPNYAYVKGVVEGLTSTKKKPFSNRSRTGKGIMVHKKTINKFMKAGNTVSAEVQAQLTTGWKFQAASADRDFLKVVLNGRGFFDAVNRVIQTVYPQALARQVKVLGYG